MSTSEQIAEMVDMLPDTEQEFAYELIKRLVLAWDPDFTKLTKSEADAIKQAEYEYKIGETVSHENIDWD